MASEDETFAVGALSPGGPVTERLRSRLGLTAALALVAWIAWEVAERRWVAPRAGQAPMGLLEVAPVFPLFLWALGASAYVRSLRAVPVHAALMVLLTTGLRVLTAIALGEEFAPGVAVGAPDFLPFLWIQILIFFIAVTLLAGGLLLLFKTLLAGD